MVVQHIKSVDEFKETIMKKSIVMIHKTGCPFCERAKPWLKKHSETYPGIIAFANKDDIAPILEVFQVKMYPTFVAFNKGKVLDVFSGDTVEEKVAAFVGKHS